MKSLLWIAILAVIVGFVPSALQNASAQIAEPQPTPIQTTEQTDDKTQLIWNCTKPDPQTQCFTKVLENGTLYVGNGNPSHEVTPSNGKFRALDVEEFDVPSETGEDVSEEYVGTSGGGSNGDSDEDYPKCNYDEDGPTNEPCYTSDGELAYDEEHLRDCGNGVRCIGEYDNDDEDTGGSNSEEEETENCGGEPCTATQKEDSCTDEESGGDGESRENLGSKLCRVIDTNQGLANLIARGLGFPGADQAALQLCSATAD